ncbi:unnamed protein product [Macrosiphum euphorbiae]|uniref:Uncharacterized protein n=1 Tax=Macrosiphum euphorbiae TaxID=13131 RepID=A0AAV0XNK4_9HEMI|nr:unnamed protein product [Macrosiphum euphorbiae]
MVDAWLDKLDGCDDLEVRSQYSEFLLRTVVGGSMRSTYTVGITRRRLESSMVGGGLECCLSSAGSSCLRGPPGGDRR